MSFISEFGLQILVGVITAILVMAIISSWKTIVLRLAMYLVRRAMRMRCKIFKKHSMKFLIGSSQWRYSCRYCLHTEIERW